MPRDGVREIGMQQRLARFARRVDEAVALQRHEANTGPPPLSAHSAVKGEVTSAIEARIREPRG
jgi:hypothetical protein